MAIGHYMYFTLSDITWIFISKLLSKYIARVSIFAIASVSTVKLKVFAKETFDKRLGPAITSTFLKTQYEHIVATTTKCTLPGHNRNVNRMLQDNGALLAPKVTRQSNIFWIINPKVFD